MRSQLRSDKNGGNKNSDRAEHICIERDQVQVIIENDLLYAGISLNKVVVLLGEVNHQNNSHQDQHRKDVGGQELLYNVLVEELHFNKFVVKSYELRVKSMQPRISILIWLNIGVFKLSTLNF